MLGGLGTSLATPLVIPELTGIPSEMSQWLEHSPDLLPEVSEMETWDH